MRDSGKSTGQFTNNLNVLWFIFKAADSDTFLHVTATLSRLFSPLRVYASLSPGDLCQFVRRQYTKFDVLRRRRRNITTHHTLVALRLMNDCDTSTSRALQLGVFRVKSEWLREPQSGGSEPSGVSAAVSL